MLSSRNDAFELDIDIDLLDDRLDICLDTCRDSGRSGFSSFSSDSSLAMRSAKSTPLFDKSAGVPCASILPYKVRYIQFNQLKRI